MRARSPDAGYPSEKYFQWWPPQVAREDLVTLYADSSYLEPCHEGGKEHIYNTCRSTSGLGMISTSIKRWRTRAFVHGARRRPRLVLVGVCTSL
jgi:hypothetical protein